MMPECDRPQKGGLDSRPMRRIWIYAAQRTTNDGRDHPFVVCQSAASPALLAHTVPVPDNVIKNRALDWRTINVNKLQAKQHRRCACQCTPGMRGTMRHL
jgi:hypothetical protein